MRKLLRFSLSSMFILTAIIAAFLGGITYLQMQPDSHVFQRKGDSVILQGDFSVKGTFLYHSGSGDFRSTFRYNDVTLIELHDACLLIARGNDTGRCIPRERLIDFEWSPAPKAATAAVVATATESDKNAP